MPAYFGFVLTLMNGLSYGALLFIIASGFTLVFGLMRVLNLAHGAIYLFGAYVGFTASQVLSHWFVSIAPELAAWGWVLGVIAAGLAGAFAALLLYGLLSQISGELPQTLLTLGVAIAIGDICLWIWGGLPRTLSPPAVFDTTVSIIGIPFPAYRVFVIGFAIALGLGLYLLLFRSQLGRIIRAGVDNREAVATTGININRLFLLVFMLGGGLAGISGAIGGSFLAFNPSTGFHILTMALFVVVIGGMGSLLGSVIGALIVGLIDSLGRFYFGDLAIFLLSGTVILVLAFRPRGLLGRTS